jgi:hypothetical protein
MRDRSSFLKTQPQRSPKKESPIANLLLVASLRSIGGKKIFCCFYIHFAISFHAPIYVRNRGRIYFATINPAAIATMMGQYLCQKELKVMLRRLMAKG